MENQITYENLVDNFHWNIIFSRQITQLNAVHYLK